MSKIMKESHKNKRGPNGGSPEPVEVRKTYTPGTEGDPAVLEEARNLTQQRPGQTVPLPSERELNIMDAQRLLRAALILHDVGIVDPKYTDIARDLTKDATALLNDGAKVARF